MSINKIFYLIILLNIIIEVLLDDRKINFEINDIKDMKGSLFNSKEEKIYYLGNLLKHTHIIAFTGLKDKNDKNTDIISYKEEETDDTINFSFYSNRTNEKNQLFNITINKSNSSKITVRNLQVGSFIHNKNEICFLVSFTNEINNKKSLIHYLYFGNNTNKYTRLDIDSNILILNKGDDKYTRLLYFKDGQRRICKLEENTTDEYVCTPDKTFSEYLVDDNSKKYIDQDISLKGGLAYVDMSGNCIPDIILSHEEEEHGERIIEIYSSMIVKNDNNKEIKYNLTDSIKIPNGSDYGAFSIVNSKGNDEFAPLLGLLIPKMKENKVYYLKNQKKIKYKWDKRYCVDNQNDEEKNRQENLFGNFNGSEIMELKIVDDENNDTSVEMDQNYPTVIRVGDFLGSSNPGIIVKHNIKYNNGTEISQISLFEQTDKGFKFYDCIKPSDINCNDTFKMGLFFDIDETGTLSFIIPTKNGENHFFFNYRRNIYFIKSKLMNDKENFYDSNLGATYRYIVSDKNGDRRMDMTYQLAQTSDMNIPLPYSYNGLGDTNNYVEYYETISGNYLVDPNTKFIKSGEENTKQNTPIIPNTQMLISKFYREKDKTEVEWNVDLIVQPMEQIWIFLIVVVFVLLVVLGIIIFLHVKEVKEEQKETTKFKSWFA